VLEIPIFAQRMHAYCCFVLHCRAPAAPGLLECALTDKCAPHIYAPRAALLYISFKYMHDPCSALLDLASWQRCCHALQPVPQMAWP
jgi:hypothetical protein